MILTVATTCHILVTVSTFWISVSTCGLTRFRFAFCHTRCRVFTLCHFVFPTFSTIILFFYITYKAKTTILTVSFIPIKHGFFAGRTCSTNVINHAISTATKTAGYRSLAQIVCDLIIWTRSTFFNTRFTFVEIFRTKVARRSVIIEVVSCLANTC